MMRNIELENVINQELNVGDFQDYAPNGLQVEGRAHIQRIVTGVTACQALLDEAVRLQADAVIVHHGYFWKNEPAVIRGMKRNRLKTLLCNDINLYGYHLPLDAHPSLGNNVQLARLINAKVVGLIEPFVPHGEFEQPITPVELAARIEQALGRKALYVGDNAPAEIRKLAGAPVVGKVLFNRRLNLVLMLSLPVKCQSRRFISPAKWGCIFMLRVIMPPNVMVLRRWESGWLVIMVWMSLLSIFQTRFSHVFLRRNSTTTD